MMHRSPTSLDACATDRLRSAKRMSKLGQSVIPACLIGRGEVCVSTAWAWGKKAFRLADAQRLDAERRRSAGRVQRGHDMPIAGNAMKAGDARSVVLEFSDQTGHACGKFG